MRRTPPRVPRSHLNSTQRLCVNLIFDAASLRRNQVSSRDLQLRREADDASRCLTLEGTTDALLPVATSLCVAVRVSGKCHRHGEARVDLLR